MAAGELGIAAQLLLGSSVQKAGGDAAGASVPTCPVCAEEVILGMCAYSLRLIKFSRVNM